MNNPPKRPPSANNSRPPQRSGARPTATAPRRPATAQPQTSGYRRGPETVSRASLDRRADGRTPARPGYTVRGKRRGPSNDFLLLLFIVLSVLLVALIITFIILRSTGESPERPDESTPPPAQSSTEPPAESHGPSDPVSAVGNLPEWKVTVSDPKAFIPTTVPSTVTLDASRVYSSNIIMVELSQKNSVCELGADERIFPASMTKLMTAIVACELIDDMSDTFVLTNEILFPLYNAGASMAYFIAGNAIPMIDLIYGTLLPSGADATAGLAIALCGSEEEFVKKMNEKAIEMGCYGTHFMNASGLHHDEHYSTVRDMATIMSYALDIPLIRDVICSKYYETIAPVDKLDGTLYCTWSGPLKGNESKKTVMLGAKTGYTDEAGSCLASLSKTPDGKEYVVVSAGAFYSESTGKMGKEQSFADVKYLCDTYSK